MEYVVDGIKEALIIIATFDREFRQIVSVSLRTAGASTLLATLTGVPLGVLVAMKTFPGRRALIMALNTLMSLPTVVIGLLVYSFLSGHGPLGRLGLLYSVTAMVIGQFILAFPIVAGLTVSAVQGLDGRIRPTLASMGADSQQSLCMFLNEARFGLFGAMVAGFGRVFSEIGVSMMLGGNIKGYTRNITTAMALETSKGEFAMGLALGIILLAIALIVNVSFGLLQRKAK